MPMIINAFERTAAKNKDKVAVETAETRISYGQLRTAIQPAADEILSKCPAGVQNVGILLEHGLEQVIALLAVLKARKTYVPLDSAYPEERLTWMVRDAELGMIITNNVNMSLAQRVCATKPGKQNICILQLDEITRENSHGDNLTQEQEESEDRLAYILYTSGSTGKPKGVMQTCQNVCFYTDVYVKALSITPADRVTHLSSFSHDGAIQDISSAILSGAVLCPLDIRPGGKFTAADIGKWLIKQKITLYHSVPTVFRYAAAALERDQVFPHLRLIVTGGEKLRPDDILLARKHFLNVEFAHMYGQTESSVNTMEFIDTKQKAGRITIGQPLEGIKLLVLNPEGEQVEPFETGEIFVASSHISPGYWKNPEATTKVFLFDEDLGPVYRTGDLGKPGIDGSIEFIGRKDYQVKIRGFRVELPEIEHRLTTNEGIKEAVVMVGQTSSNEEYIYAYLVPSAHPPGEPELKKFLEKHLPYYMIPTYFEYLEKMSMTSTGKLDRAALPEPKIKKNKIFVPPRNELDAILVKLWSKVLEIPAPSISIDDNFFELGGHSLKAALLILNIHEELDIKIPLTKVFEGQTLRKLAQYIREAEDTGFVHIKPVEKKEYYPSSSAQKRVYFTQQMKINSTAYNMPFVLAMGKDIEVNKLESTLAKLLTRHESLRTFFQMVDNELVQKIQDEVEFKMEYYDLQVTGDGDRCRWESKPLGRINTVGDQYPESQDPGVKNCIDSFIRPFDLSRAPLIRSALIKNFGGSYIWIVDMHHIISDGTSQAILAGDFIFIYNGETQGPLKLQYKDFSQWQNRLFACEDIKVQENYWLQLYGDAKEIPRLILPNDYERPGIFTFAGDTYRFMLEREDAVKFRTLASLHGGTLFMNILALLNLLFYKYSSQTDIIIGTASAGRAHADLQRTVGMFVNILVMRNSPTADKTYEFFLEEVIINSINAFENQDVQFEELLNKLEVERDTSGHPLFGISLVVQNFSQLKELPVTVDAFQPFQPNNTTSRFDMTFFIHEQAEDIYITIEYYTGIFKKETIKRMVSHFKNVIKIIVHEPTIKLKDIEIITEQEKKQLVYEFNDTAGVFPGDKSIGELFAEQAGQTPDKIAVIGPLQLKKYRTYISYKELNEKSNQLAHLLRKKGIKPDTIVGIMMERSIQMIIGILGILKAGGAYLPIDANYPEDRIKYMLADSSAKFLVTAYWLLEKIRKLSIVNCQLLIVNEMQPNHRRLNNPPKEAIPYLNLSPAPVTSLAYIIYTSGTTGTPKGVLIDQRSIVNYSVWRIKAFDFTHRDVTLQLLSPMFDGFCANLYPAILSGGKIVLAGNVEILVPWAADEIQKEKITHISVVPSLYQAILEFSRDETLKTLRIVVLAGEKTLESLLNDSQRLAPNTILINEYGPTEAAVGVTAYKGMKSGNVSIIGQPITNITISILDNHNNLVPIGVSGQICIGGVGVARGYLDNPELTAEKFDHDLWDLWDYQDYHDEKLLRGVQGGGFLEKSPPGRRRQRMYKTGDLGRWLPDGNIEFSGRMDRQVKIRGHRLELGEIESRLADHELIKEAVVIEIKKNSGETSLCAYIVPREPFDFQQLRGFLSATLPAVMIPDYLIEVHNIPLTPNGKIDRKALPVPEFKPGETYQAPGDEIEESLTIICSQVLNIDKNVIGMETNFFDMGGNSLSLVSLVSKVNKEFKCELPVIHVFKNPTLKYISHLIKSKKYIEEDVFLLNRLTERKIFCFPPGIGFGVSYYSLAALITGYSLYGFNFIEDENRIDQYVNLITNFQTRGPYILLGWSAAGGLLVDVTITLERCGFRVSDIILVDCPWLELMYPHREFGEKQIEALNRLGKQTEEIGLLFYVDKVKKKMEKYIKYNMQLSHKDIIHAHVHLILSEENKDKNWSSGWKRSTDKTFTCYRGFGGHEDMLLPGPALEKNAALILEILENIFREQGYDC